MLGSGTKNDDRGLRRMTVKISSGDYGVTNAMEEIVDLAIVQVLSEDPSACDCPQCLIDLKCLILNRLKNKYRPNGNDGTQEVVKLSDLDRDLFNKVIAESLLALAKVKANPRHEANSTSLINCVEEIAIMALQDILKQEKRELNYGDLSLVMASILNSLEPRYTTTQKGQVFCRTVEVDPSYLAKVYSAIYNALGSLSEIKATS